MKKSSRNILTEIRYNRPYIEVFEMFKKALDAKNFYIADAELDRKCIRVNTGVTTFSWGEDLEITFRGEKSTRVQMNYQNYMSFFRKFFLKREGALLLREVEKNLN
ncbi:MAG: hypothetical protein WDZ35_03715 [Crocinitomicaceae bacterium]